MRYLTIILGLLTTVQLVGQPVPTDAVKAKRGHYVFAVYSPTTTAETIVWRMGATELTTHRLFDATDSTEVRFRPEEHAVLRTYFTTEAHLGAAAGAGEVVRAGEDNIVIGELLHYPALLSPEQRQLTESYLAIGHGLTLDQSRPVNYLASDGTTAYPIWTATAEPDFRHRITGLARDEQYGLDRTQAHSVLAPDLLRLSWAESPTATTYLVLADDDGPTARPPGERLLQRRWRVETTGAPPPTTLTFDTRRCYDRAQPGDTWNLLVTQPDGTVRTYPAEASTTAGLTFPNIPFPTDTVVHFQLQAAQSAQVSTTTDLFSAVSLSPNPISVGATAQLRAALTESKALTLTAYDGHGRLVYTRRLGRATHHLADLTFPASGAYTVHLRPRPDATPSETHVLKVVVQ